MQLLDDGFVYSATDLNNYLECGHLVALERRVASDGLERPEKRAAVDLIAQKGLDHEKAYLETLRARFPGGVVEIDASTRDRAAIDRAVAATIAAMASGAPVIYQGTFFDGQFLGKSDFLLRVERPSALWHWSYEVVDTKLALKDKPYFIIQLENYSEHLARVQGTMPLEMHVVLGNGRRATHRVDDYAAYYRHLKASFLQHGISDDRYPYPCSHCDVCGWTDICARKRVADDHLSLVAGMRRTQADALAENGTPTLAALGSATAARPAGMPAETFERLRRQASLQLRGRIERANLYELLDQLPSTGFGLLPPPAAGDVYFDMEGDPLYEIGTGLEYLFGFFTLDAEGTFVPFWGTDRAAEKIAFERAVDFIVQRRAQFPDMHVYHYAPYEKTALRKLSQRHGTREKEIDDILRGEILVDLYAVVRQSVMISQSSYSIKKLEAYYGLERTSDVKRGDDSVLQFEAWLERRDDAILDDIATYNADDCRSTYLLHEWLLARRGEYAAEHPEAELVFRRPRDGKGPCHDEPVDTCPKCVVRERERKELEKLSADQIALAARTGDRSAVLLSHLMSYHRREDKPVWWALYDRCENVDGLVEFDREAIGGLSLRTDIEPYKLDRSTVYTYAFPEQLHHLRDNPFDAATAKLAGTIVGIDEDALTIAVKRTVDANEAARLRALVPGAPIVARVQQAALARLGHAYLTGDFARTHPAANDLLAALPPRLRGQTRGQRIQPGVVSVESVLAVVRQLDESYLFLQGPPGTGKTYTGARVITALLREGKRVGVMANSHKAMHNMLHAIEAHARELALSADDLRGVHKHSNSNDGSPYVSDLGAAAYVTSEDKAFGEASSRCNLISGNAWLFAREEMTGSVDYLFVDEAGQISLADALAVAPAAQNVVLLGDPMQLAQVSQGVHLENAGRSVLEHLLGDRATIAPERGILLDISYRMQPAICDFISKTMYDGRVHSDRESIRNRIDSALIAGGGISYLPVTHDGNGRESPQEAAAIAAAVDALLRGSFVRKGDAPQPLTEHDVLVVTPYNAQRKRIEAALAAAGFAGVRVGTVDKFQGQEAPVVFYSMATSNGEELPRNMEFLFEKNRFNVAISRAQCAAILVCSPDLLDIRCRSVDQMKLVNVVCRYVEDAAALSLPAAALA